MESLRKKKEVISIIGNKEILNDCILIKGEYHNKDKDCIIINDVPYSLYLREVYKDYYTNEYVVTTANTVIGIVKYEKETYSFILGYIEYNDNLKKIMINRKTLYINNEIFNEIPFIYNHKSNTNILKCDVPNSILLGNSSIREYNNLHRYTANYNYTFKREYSSSKYIDKFSSTTNDKLKTNKKLNEKDIKEFGNFSFGLEFETSSGNIEESDCFKYGLIPLKDGSINGHEFTTIPMKGKEGLTLLLNQIELLNKNVAIDKECSLHVHFGGFPNIEKYIISLYNVLYSIQDEISEMFPKLIFNTSKYKKQRKDYCNKLEEHNNFKSLYYFLSSNNLKYSGSLTDYHPLDEENEHKWNISPRYKWANFINLCFKESGKTIEFRIHNPTLNKEKIINWMFICSSMLQYTMNNVENINKQLENNMKLKLSLTEIITNVYSDRISNQLLSYIQERKDYFNICYNNFKDDYGVFDLIEDSSQTFNTNLLGEE